MKYQAAKRDQTRARVEAKYDTTRGAPSGVFHIGYSLLSSRSITPPQLWRRANPLPAPKAFPTRICSSGNPTPRHMRPTFFYRRAVALIQLFIPTQYPVQSPIFTASTIVMYSPRCTQYKRLPFQRSTHCEDAPLNAEIEAGQSLRAYRQLEEQETRGVVRWTQYREIYSLLIITNKTTSTPKQKNELLL